jgi:hypothetical protein
MSLPGLLVVHDSVRSSHDDVSELPGRHKVGGPSLDLVELDVEARRDDATLVDPAVQVDDDLAVAAIVDDLELSNVSILHHHLQELDHHLRK